MWFRIFLASWSVAFLALLGWLATHQSSEPSILGRYSPGYCTLLLGIGALVMVSLLAQQPFLYRRLHAVRREIILTLSSIVISLIISEVAIRVLDPLGVSYFEEVSRYHLDKLPDPIRVFKHAPGLQRTYQGVRVFINDLGLRDRNLEKKEDGELRILLLGDSVTFGWGVPMEATFGRKMESTLASKLGRPVRTVNTGVGGYNTVQEYAVLRTYAEVIEPDIVVLLYVTNDIETNDPPVDPWSQVSLQRKSPPEVIAVLLSKSWLFRLGSFVFRYSHSNGPASVNKNARGVKESMEALSGIATFCRDHGINFVIFFYRSKGETLRGLSSALFSEIQTIGQTHGFPVADVGSWWGDVDMRSVANSTIDSHPNERGHEILAAGMADFLMTEGLVSGTGQYSH
jgi:GDSL-like lipase/acylhydrolase family protein